MDGRCEMQMGDVETHHERRSATSQLKLKCYWDQCGEGERKER